MPYKHTGLLTFNYDFAAQKPIKTDKNSQFDGDRSVTFVTFLLMKASLSGEIVIFAVIMRMLAAKSEVK